MPYLSETSLENQVLLFLCPASLSTVSLYFGMAVLLCHSPPYDVSLAENVEHVVLAGIIPLN